MRRCEACGKELPEGSTSRRRYCDSTCRLAAHFRTNEGGPIVNESREGQTSWPNTGRSFSAAALTIEEVAEVFNWYSVNDKDTVNALESPLDVINLVFMKTNKRLAKEGGKVVVYDA